MKVRYKSEFDSVSELFDGDDERLEELWNKEYSLTAFTDPSNFKSYDELKARFNQVVGADIRSTETVTETVESEPAVREDSTGEETDALDYFERLAKE